MVTQEQFVSDIEARARMVGVPIYRACWRAGIAPSTFYRWKGGAAAQLAKLNLLSDTLGAIEAEVREARNA